MSIAREAQTQTFAPRALPGLNTRSWMAVAAVVAVCLLPVLFYLPFLQEPFMRDEGFYASVAQSILHGGIPYRDAFDNKPPLIFGWYTLSFLLFGQNVWAPRLLVSLLLCATAGLVYVEGRLLFTHRKALAAAGMFSLSIGLASFETNANTEYFMLLPMVGGLVCFTLGQQRGHLGWYAAAGFLSGIAIMTKETSQFAPLLFIGLAVLPAVRSQGWGAFKDRDAMRKAGGLVAGSVAAAGLVVAPFIVSGTFGAFLDAVVLYTLQYVGDVPLLIKLVGVARAPAFLLVFAAPWALLTALAAFSCLKQGNDRNWLLVGWFAAGVAGIFAAGRFYNHYYVQLLPAMALLAPVGWEFLRSQWGSRNFRRAAYAIAPVVILLTMIVNGDIYVQPNAAERHEAKYRFTEVTEWETQSPALGAYLAARTSPGDLIYNLGYQSELYFYADRRSPSRFLFDYAFAVDPKFEQEALRDLQARNPLYIVDSARYEPKAWDASNYYPTRIKSFIDANYDFVGKVYYADVYRLKSAP